MIKFKAIHAFYLKFLKVSNAQKCWVISFFSTVNLFKISDVGINNSLENLNRGSQSHEFSSNFIVYVFFKNLNMRVHTHTHIYIYIYIYIRDAFNKFPESFCTGIKNCRSLLKIQYVIAIHIMRWLTKFYDFRLNWTATAVIGIHPTKAWLSLLVNFKNAIWTYGHLRRTICNKILF